MPLSNWMSKGWKRLLRSDARRISTNQKKNLFTVANPESALRSSSSVGVVNSINAQNTTPNTLRRAASDASFKIKDALAQEAMSEEQALPTTLSHTVTRQPSVKKSASHAKASKKRSTVVVQAPNDNNEDQGSVNGEQSTATQSRPENTDSAASDDGESGSQVSDVPRTSPTGVSVSTNNGKMPTAARGTASTAEQSTLRATTDSTTYAPTSRPTHTVTEAPPQIVAAPLQPQNVLTTHVVDSTHLGPRTSPNSLATPAAEGSSSQPSRMVMYHTSHVLLAQDGDPRHTRLLPHAVSIPQNSPTYQQGGPIYRCTRPSGHQSDHTLCDTATCPDCPDPERTQTATAFQGRPTMHALGITTDGEFNGTMWPHDSFTTPFQLRRVRFQSMHGRILCDVHVCDSATCDWCITVGEDDAFIRDSIVDIGDSSFEQSNMYGQYAASANAEMMADRSNGHSGYMAQPTAASLYADAGPNFEGHHRNNNNSGGDYSSNGLTPNNYTNAFGQRSTVVAAYPGTRFGAVTGPPTYPSSMAGAPTYPNSSAPTNTVPTPPYQGQFTFVPHSTHGNQLQVMSQATASPQFAPLNANYVNGGTGGSMQQCGVGMQPPGMSTPPVQTQHGPLQSSRGTVQSNMNNHVAVNTQNRPRGIDTSAAAALNGLAMNVLAGQGSGQKRKAEEDLGGRTGQSKEASGPPYH